MCDAEGNGLESLMGVFKLPNVDIRVCVFYFSTIIDSFTPCYNTVVQ